MAYASSLLAEEQVKKFVMVQEQPSTQEVPEVPWDLCTGRKTVKPCPVCMMSYFQAHLEPHQLIDPVENTEDGLKHNKPIGILCKTDKVCVSQLCCESDHKLHVFVSSEEECEGKRAELQQKEAQIQQMIRERQYQIQQLRRSVKLSEEDADREIANGVTFFNSLMHAIERGKAELVSTIRDKQKSAEVQAQAIIQELEEEMIKLTKKCTKLEKVLDAEDHIHLLQIISFGVTIPPCKDWTIVNVQQPSHVGTVRRALENLYEILDMETKAQCDAELKKLRHYKVDVTLDPETAHPSLVLSNDGKQVFGTNANNTIRKHVALLVLCIMDNPKRFTCYTNVLGKQTFSTGRHYYEVQVKGKTHWELGIVRESINRKERITMTPKDGLWSIYMKKGNMFRACGSPAVHLPPRENLQKVGMYVDYDEGLVSFYDVESRAHIYSFSGYFFTEVLIPIFSPDIDDDGKNSAPLIITPVNKSD